MIQDLDKMETTQELATHIKRVLKNRSELFETRHKRKDGSLFSVEISVMCMESYNKIVMVCFCRDITERNTSGRATYEKTLEENVPTPF